MSNQDNHIIKEASSIIARHHDPLLDYVRERISQETKNINTLSEMGGEVYNAAVDKKKASKQLIKGLKGKVRDLGNDKLAIDTGDEHAVIVQIIGLQ